MHRRRHFHILAELNLPPNGFSRTYEKCPDTENNGWERVGTDTKNLSGVCAHWAGRTAGPCLPPQPNGSVWARRAVEAHFVTPRRWGTTTDDGLELFGLSRICERRGEKKRARQLYEQSIATVLPTEADRAARHALARLAEQNGDLLRARELWKSTLGNFRRATKPTSSWRSTLRTRGVSLCKPWRLCGTRWPNCTTGSKQERLRLLRTAGRKHGSSIGLLVSNTGPGGRCSIKFHRPNLPPARPMTNSNWITGCWRRSSHGWRKAVLEKKLDALLAITFVTDLKELRSRAEKLEDTDAELAVRGASLDSHRK